MGTFSQLGPAATALVASVALIVGIATVSQRARSDRRDQWCKRAQWAIDQALADHTDDRRTIGHNALSLLGRSRPAGSEVPELLRSLGVDQLRPLAPPIDLEDHGGGDETTAGGAVQ